MISYVLFGYVDFNMRVMLAFDLLQSEIDGLAYLAR
jgi:hypothetical protein